MSRGKTVTFCIGGHRFTARIFSAAQLRVFVYAAALVAGFMALETIGHTVEGMLQ